MPTDITPTVLSKVGIIPNPRTTYDDTFADVPLLEAAADLNGTFDDEEAEAVARGNLRWAVIGGGAVAPVTQTGGGIKLTTGTTGGNETVLEAHTGTGGNTYLSTLDWSTDNQLAFYAKIKTHSVISGTVYFAGFKLTEAPETATDAEQVFFRYEDAVNGGKWQFITSDNGTDDARDTGVTVAASTTYELYFEVDADRQPRAYINTDGGGWVQVATGVAPLGTGHDLLPFVGVGTSNTTASILTVRRVALGMTDTD